MCRCSLKNPRTRLHLPPQQLASPREDSYKHNLRGQHFPSQVCISEPSRCSQNGDSNSCSHLCHVRVPHTSHPWQRQSVLFVGAGELAAKTELLWSRRAVRISQAYQHSRCAVCEWLFHILFADLFDLYFSFQLALRESRGRRLRLSASRLANSFCHSAICTLTSAMISFRLHLFTERGRKEGKDGQLEGSFLEWILFLWPCGTQGLNSAHPSGWRQEPVTILSAHRDMVVHRRLIFV